MDLLHYVETEFATFDEKPFNELDAAVFTQLAMVRVELAAQAQGNYQQREDGVLVAPDGSEDLHFALRDLLCAECLDHMFTGLAAPRVRECLMAAAMSPRYRRVVITRYQEILDAGKATQFAAMTFSCSNFTFIGFRGTDSTLTGWREDFNLAFMNPVPAQALALSYMARELEICSASKVTLYVGGHSKGGNLAEYVMLTMPTGAVETVNRAYSFDGPGFKAGAFSEEQFQSLGQRFVKLVPQDSVVGMILDSESAFEVVESTEMGFMQHDLFSWKVTGTIFQRREGLTQASRTIDLAAREWIHAYSDQEISAFADALFDAAEASGALDLHTLFGGGMDSVQYLRTAAAYVEGPRADTIKRFAADLAEALGSAAVDRAEDALKTAYDQARDQVEGKIRTVRDRGLSMVGKAEAEGLEN